MGLGLWSTEVVGDPRIENNKGNHHHDATNDRCNTYKGLHRLSVEIYVGIRFCDTLLNRPHRSHLNVNVSDRLDDFVDDGQTCCYHADPRSPALFFQEPNSGRDKKHRQRRVQTRDANRHELRLLDGFHRRHGRIVHGFGRQHRKNDRRQCRHKCGKNAEGTENDKDDRDDRDRSWERRGGICTGVLTAWIASVRTWRVGIQGRIGHRRYV